MKTFREKLASLVIIPDMGGSTDGKIRLSSGSESWNSVDQIIQLIKEDLIGEGPKEYMKGSPASFENALRRE